MNYYSSAFPVLTSSKGIAYEIYLAGCRGYCEGCHSPHTWDFNAGIPMEEVWPRLRDSLIENRELFDNIVILGGEPLDHGQELEFFLKKLDREFPDKSIYLYTHFEIGNVREDVFKWVDYIKCGRYIKSLPNDKPDPLVNVTLASSNQYFVEGDREGKSHNRGVNRLEYIKALNDKDTKLMAVDKETEVAHEVDSIHFPLGKPSGKDIAIICNDDKDLLEWRSTGEVTLYFERDSEQ